MRTPNGRGADPAGREEKNQTRRLDKEPPRGKQDAQPMDGDAATHLPAETDLIQKPKVQG